MNDKADAIEKKIEEYKEKLGFVNEAVMLVENQVKIERTEIPADSKELEKKIQKATTELEKIQVKINENKQKAKDLKSQITEKKAAFEKSEQEKRPEHWAQLASKIKPMGHKIIACESTISALEMQKHAAEQALEFSLMSLEAYNQGFVDQPIEEDPRLREVLKEKNRIDKYIEKKEQELAEVQS